MPTGAPNSGCWWSSAQTAVRPDNIIIFIPALRQNFCLVPVAQDLAIQEFVPHSSVEALIISVLPRTTRLYIGCDYTNVLQPFPQFVGC